MLYRANSFRASPYHRSLIGTLCEMQHKALSAANPRIELTYDAEGYVPLEAQIGGGATFLDDDPVGIEIRIVGRGGPWKSRDIALGETAILMDLLNMEETPEGAAAFAGKWGLFRHPRPNVLAPPLETGRGALWDIFDVASRPSPPKSCPVEEFYKAKREIREGWKHRKKAGAARELVRLRGNFEQLVIAAATIRLTRRNQTDMLPAVHYYAEDLRAFCWLELWRECGGAAELMECAKCRKVFARKAKGRAPETCSPRCKKAKQRSENKRRRPGESKRQQR